jgi:uncharacterized repeat protein (TIGR03806 family)
LKAPCHSRLDTFCLLGSIVLGFAILGGVVLGSTSCSQKKTVTLPDKTAESTNSGTQTSAADTAVKVGPTAPGKSKLRDRRGMAYGLTTRVSLQGIKLPLDRTAPGSVILTRIWPKNRVISRPLFLTHAPDGSHRLFVVEQYGRITVMPDTKPTSTGQPFLDIRTKVYGGGERGLLGLAFDPDYSKNGYFYVYYSISNPHRSVIARFTVSSTNPNQADPKSEKVLLVIAQPTRGHNGGMLAFGKDGMLYIGMGDGGSTKSSQDTSTLLGSMLRIDPRGSAGYSIPKDNPFVGKSGYRPEIWAYGLRNPWRFSFDRQNGRLWCGDVGANAWEELDIIVKGGNYAWPFFEGNKSYWNPGKRKPSEFDMPLIDVGHSLARCITGGYVYRGNKLPALRGAYIYGDFATGRIWALVYDDKTKKVISNTQIASMNSISSFGEDRDGEIYVVNWIFRQIYRIDRKGASNPGGKIPRKLSLTGLFSDTAKLIPNPGLIEYDVNAPSWTDGATQRRWIGIPDNKKIQANPAGSLLPPTGSFMVQQLYLDTGTATPTRVETRVLIHEKQGWSGYTYRWNAAQTDADLAYDGGQQTFKVKDASASGGFRNQTWNFPSASDCMSCHNDTAAASSVRYAQLNRGFQYRTVADNQLRAWNNIGLFNPPLAETKIHELPAHEDPYGSTGTLGQRARAYLDVNCASCHTPGGPAPGSMDMRSQTKFVDMNLFGIKPSEGGLGNPHRILPGQKANSVLWERMRRTDSSRMPELGSTLMDKKGVQLIGSWIDSLK